ncbi:MAG TPA: hypothetical protein VNM91_01315 [Dehalococcoidia bacterium]|nr:hypothetical protein [Dehalococcoidia bacterium]
MTVRPGPETYVVYVPWREGRDVRRFTEDLQATLDAIRAEGGEVIAALDHTVVYGGNATAGHWIYWRKRETWADPDSASR